MSQPGILIDTLQQVVVFNLKLAQGGVLVLSLPFSLDLEEVGLVSPDEDVVLKINGVVLTADLVEIVHVKLN